MCINKIVSGMDKSKKKKSNLELFESSVKKSNEDMTNFIKEEEKPKHLGKRWCR